MDRGLPGSRRPGGLAALGLAALLCFAGLGAPLALAQGWWPWSSPDRPAPPPAPRIPAPIPPPQPQPGPPGVQRPGTGPQTQICLQLEQRLVAEGQRGSSAREQLPKIEGEMRQLERVVQTSNQQLEQGQCYEYWLFSKTIRRTRQCLDLVAQNETARRRLQELDAQRQQLLGSRERSYQDEIIRELARNNCGATYQAEAAKRGGSGPFGSFWQDEDTGPGQQSGQIGTLPYSTYRTLCVRLCDGYYFPISYATLQNHFQRDQDACQSRCAAPVELYYHQNPGGAVEQMLSFKSQAPYTSLKTAFRYRQQMVPGCSCKAAEYVPSAADKGERKAEVAPPAVPAAHRPPR